MSEPVLKVSNYSIDFWVEGVWYPAAIDMNFELQAGKVLAIVGESGSGKSTTGMGLMDLLASNARVAGSVKPTQRQHIKTGAAAPPPPIAAHWCHLCCCGAS